MNKKIFQKKRDYLIELMQGTKESPNLKYTREEILGIDTASKLAEILGITRQTMSRLESCTTKLSAAQYLAICGIIDRKKNEMLYNINHSINKGKSIMKLFDMSFYFDTSFSGTILQDDIYNIYMTSKDDSELVSKLDNISIKEENLNKLSRMTCMDKWLSTFEIHESISQEELFSKGCNIIILDRLKNKNTIQGIVKTMRAFTKYSNNDMKTYLYLDYNGVLSYLKNAISYFEKNTSIANNFIEFTTSFLLLYKNNKIQFLTDNHYITDLTVPKILVIQDEDEAMKTLGANEKMTKYISSLKSSDNKSVRTLKILAKELNNEEIVYYDDNCFKRWYFDEKEISDEVKEELEKIQCEEFLKDFITESKRLALLKKSNIDEQKTDINGALDDELENVLTKFLSYLNPKTN